MLYGSFKRLKKEDKFLDKFQNFFAYFSRLTHAKQLLYVLFCDTTAVIEANFRNRELEPHHQKNRHTVLSRYIVDLETWSTLKHSLGKKT